MFNSKVVEIFDIFIYFLLLLFKLETMSSLNFVSCLGFICDYLFTCYPYDMYVLDEFMLNEKMSFYELCSSC